MHVAALFKTRDRYRVLECSPNIISCSRCPVQKDTLFKTLEVIFSLPLLLLLLLLLFCLWSSSSLFYSWSSFFLFPTDRPGSFNSISFSASPLLLDWETRDNRPWQGLVSCPVLFCSSSLLLSY